MNSVLLPDEYTGVAQVANTLLELYGAGANGGLGGDGLGGGVGGGGTGGGCGGDGLGGGVGGGGLGGGEGGGGSGGGEGGDGLGGGVGGGGDGGPGLGGGGRGGGLGGGGLGVMPKFKVACALPLAAPLQLITTVTFRSLSVLGLMYSMKLPRLAVQLIALGV